MSKGARNRRSSRRIHKPAKHAVEPLVDHRKMMKVAGVIVVVVLVAIPFGLGKYFEFNSPDPFDSGSNVYSAAHILEHMVPHGVDALGLRQRPMIHPHDHVLLGTLTGADRHRLVIRVQHDE